MNSNRNSAKSKWIEARRSSGHRSNFILQALLSFLLLGHSLLAFADLSHLDLKGIHALVDHPGASPVYGYLVLKTFLENRRFHGNYGDSETGFFCSNKKSKIGQLFKQNHDCPLDANSEWIQRLFPSQDRINFVANQVPFDPVSHLTPRVIGQILARIAAVHDEDWMDSPKMETLSADLGLLLKVKKGVGSKKELSALAPLLVSALRESRVLHLYSKYLPEQVLLAYFIKKSNQKTDLLELFQGMPTLIKNSDFLIRPGLQASFLKDQWKKTDYQPHRILQEPHKVAQEMVQNPEFLTFNVMEEKLNRQVPPVLSYGSAQHSSLGDSQYPDCGETSLRNFFNIVLYDQKRARFDSEILDHIENEQLKLQPNASLRLRFDPSLKAFYAQHSDPSLSVSQSVRNDWSEKVVSGHSDVNYKRAPLAGGIPQCEITGGIDGMISVLNRLIFYPSDRPGVSERAKIFDLLVAAFSRPDHLLTWRVEGSTEEESSRALIRSKNKDLTVIFEVNDSPLMSWAFLSGHYSVSDLTAVESSWKNSISQELMGFENSEIPMILPWFLTFENYDLLTKRIISGNLQKPTKKSDKDPSLEISNVLENLIYSIPIGSNEGKIFAFQKILASQSQLSAPQFEFFKPLAMRLRATLPEEQDYFTQRQIHIALADAGFPWGGAPAHPLNKPNVTYTQVSYAQLVAHYGEEIAAKMGITWIRELFGHKIAIGEPLRDERTGITTLSYHRAIESCLDLNPVPRRQEVADVFYKREGELRKVRLGSLSSKIARSQMVNEVYSQNPVPGCYLMSKEEWEVLEDDFSLFGGKYFPQFLPKMDEHAYWTSSLALNDSNKAFVFDTLVYADYRGSFFEVRCGCLF